MINKKIKVVEDILEDLNVKAKIIKVFNKIDLLNKKDLKDIKDKIFDKFDKKDCLFISAKDKVGIQDIVDRIEKEIE